MAKKKFFTTSEQVDELVALYQSGQGSVELAERFSCSVPVVLKTLRDNEVEIRSASQAGKSSVQSGRIKKVRIQIDRDEFERLFPVNSLQSLADHFEVSVDTVSSRAKTWGLRRTEEERQALISNSMFQSYGRKSHKQSHWSERTVEILKSRDSLRDYLQIFEEKPSVREVSVDLGCAYDFLTTKLHHFESWDLVTRKYSHGERELYTLLSSWGVDVVKNDRRVLEGQEIDLYSPSRQIGIEFNGDYWHGTFSGDLAPEHSKHSTYHQKKSRLAEEKGVFLYHVFEYEWSNETSRERIINQLRNVFGQNESTIGARKCQIVEVSPQEKNDFLEANHVQGKDSSSIKLGLRYQDELVAVMTFVRPRFTKKYQWELSRFCTKAGVNVSGGASRLFRHFTETYSPESVVSYSNVVKTRGTLYQTLGFEYQYQSEPNYVWTNGVTYFPRYQTQMKNEVETMESRGYWRVFDCGSKVWVWSS